jgi:hypothetical protein
VQRRYLLHMFAWTLIYLLIVLELGSKIRTHLSKIIVIKHHINWSYGKLKFGNRKQWLIWSLMEQLSIAQCSGYPTYWNTSYDEEEQLAGHKSFISSLNILFNKEHDDFSRLYWIPKLYKNPYRGNTTTGGYSFWRK